MPILRNSSRSRFFVSAPAHKPTKDDWSNKELQDAYMQHLAEQLKFTKAEDWYSLTYDQILAHQGGSLVAKYDHSPVALVTAAFPSHPWQPWRFNVVPKGFWSDRSNLLQYLEWLGGVLGYRSPEDWYKLSVLHLRSNYGRGALSVYNWSPLAIVSAAFPGRVWLPWKFGHVPPNFWQNNDNCRSYLDWLAKELGYTKAEDWYKITKFTLLRRNGGGLLARFKSSIFRMFGELIPEVEWRPWKFVATTKGFFRSAANWKLFLDSIAKDLNIQSMEDWYKVTVRDLIKQGAPTLYARPLHEILQDAYPDHQWAPWKFAHMSKGYWANEMTKSDESSAQIRTKLRLFMQHTAKNAGIKDMEDWYRVPKADLSLRERLAIRKLGGIERALRLAFPDHSWDSTRFSLPPTHKKSTQLQVLRVLQAMYPTIRAIASIMGLASAYQSFPPAIVEQFNLQAIMQFGEDQKKVELDIYVKSKQMALEYEGEGHYFDTFLFGKFADTEAQDQFKCIVCATTSITLIQVPYWWKRDKAAMARTAEWIGKCPPPPPLLSSHLPLSAVPKER